LGSISPDASDSISDCAKNFLGGIGGAWGGESMQCALHDGQFWACFISLALCSLSWNNISDSGAHALSEALKVNQSLQKLEWVQSFMLYFLIKRCVCTWKLQCAHGLIYCIKQPG